MLPVPGTTWPARRRRCERRSSATAVQSKSKERLGADHSTNYPWALADGAIGFAHAGLFEEAREWLARAESAAIDSPYGEQPNINIIYRRAQLALETGNLDEAAELISELRSRPNHQIGVDLLSGRMTFLTGQIEQSAAYYENYLEERAPADIRVVGPPLIESLVALGELDRAAPIHERLMNEPRREPNFYDARARLASAAFARATGNSERCRELAESALRLLEPEIIAPTVRLAEAKTRLASCLTTTQPERARALFGQAVETWSTIFGPRSWPAGQISAELRKLDELGAPINSR